MTALSPAEVEAVTAAIGARLYRLNDVAASAERGGRAKDRIVALAESADLRSALDKLTADLNEVTR